MEAIRSTVAAIDCCLKANKSNGKCCRKRAFPAIQRVNGIEKQATIKYIETRSIDRTKNQHKYYFPIHTFLAVRYTLNFWLFGDSMPIYAQARTTMYKTRTNLAHVLKSENSFTEKNCCLCNFPCWYDVLFAFSLFFVAVAVASLFSIRLFLLSLLPLCCFTCAHSDQFIRPIVSHAQQNRSYIFISPLAITCSLSTWFFCTVLLKNLRYFFSHFRFSFRSLLIELTKQWRMQMCANLFLV